MLRALPAVWQNAEESKHGLSVGLAPHTGLQQGGAEELPVDDEGVWVPTPRFPKPGWFMTEGWAGGLGHAGELPPCFSLTLIPSARLAAGRNRLLGSGAG